MLTFGTHHIPLTCRQGGVRTGNRACAGSGAAAGMRSTFQVLAETVTCNPSLWHEITTLRLVLLSWKLRRASRKRRRRAHSHLRPGRPRELAAALRIYKWYIQLAGASRGANPNPASPPRVTQLERPLPPLPHRSPPAPLLRHWLAITMSASKVAAEWAKARLGRQQVGSCAIPRCKFPQPLCSHTL